jgi:hypothetical protein
MANKTKVAPKAAIKRTAVVAKTTKTASTSAASTSGTFTYAPKAVYQIFKSYMRNGSTFKNVGTSKTRWATVRDMVSWYNTQNKTSLNVQRFGQALNAAHKVLNLTMLTNSIVVGKDRINVYRVGK